MEADHLRELARLPDVLAVCSSAGWTDQKHMLYLSLLQESFVNRLYEGEISLRGLFSTLSPRASRPKQSSKLDREKSMAKVEIEQIRPPCSQNPEDGEVHSMDDDASATETVQESSSSQASATSPGQPSTFSFGKRKNSPSRTTTYSCVSSEGSDQNFTVEDVEDTKGTGESRRRRAYDGRGNKRLKSADGTVPWMIKCERGVASMKAELQQVGCLNARVEGTDGRDGSSEVGAGSLDAGPGSSSCKGHAWTKRIIHTHETFGLTMCTCSVLCSPE